jgi:hypothetical protein
MFCDMVVSTRLSRQLDARRWSDNILYSPSVLQFFSNHPTEKRLDLCLGHSRLVGDVGPQGTIDKGLVAAAPLLMDPIMEPLQEVIIQADRNPQPSIPTVTNRCSPCA